MFSFDMKSLFMNVPLKKSIDIILENVSDEKVIKIMILKSIVKD